MTLRHLAHKCGHDAAQEPFLVYPTLHYQNGGVAIDKDGATSVPGLYCVGEVTGGIHGRNRLMGNALLDILSMGRRAGAQGGANRGRQRDQRPRRHRPRARVAAGADAGRPAACT